MLAKTLGIFNGTVDMCETGKRIPGFYMLNRFSEMFAGCIDYIIESSEDYRSTALTEEEVVRLSEWVVEEDYEDMLRRYALLDDYGKRAIASILRTEFNRVQEQGTLNIKKSISVSVWSKPIKNGCYPKKQRIRYARGKYMTIRTSATKALPADKSFGTIILKGINKMAKKTPEQISFNMKQVKNKDSKIELLLRHELWSRNMRYRKNVTTVFGKPDIAFIGRKIAIFVDSEFWHGYNWETKQYEIKSNQEFWIHKIERNMERDKEVNDFLTKHGWIVLRFWGNDIKKDVAACTDIIEASYEERKPHAV